MQCSVNLILTRSALPITCRCGFSRATPRAKCKAASGDRLIGLGAQSTCYLLLSLTAVRGSVHACLPRRKRLHGRAVVLESASTLQAFKHLTSISGTG